MSNFLVDAIGNIERDYDPEIKESAKTEKLKFTEPKLSDEVRYNTNIPYDKIGKIDSYIDKYESETLKVSDSLSFSEYDKKNEGKEVVSVTEGMSQHATEVYEKLKMEHKELSYSEKDKVIFIENVKKELIDKNQLEKLPDIDEKLGKIYDDVANNIEKLPPEYGISMNKAITEYKEMLNMQTGQDPEAIKNILTMHYNSLLKQLREEKILTGPELEKLQELDQNAIEYYNKKYIESDKGEIEKTKFKDGTSKEEYLTTELNANEDGVKTKPTPPREGFTLSEDSLLSDKEGKNTKFDKDKVDSLGDEKKGFSENLSINTDTASYDSLAEDRVMKYDRLIPSKADNNNYQVINNGTETYAESTKFDPNIENADSYNKLTHINDNNDGYKVIQTPGKSTTYAEAAVDRNDARSNNIYKEYISMKEGIPENYGEHEKDFWDYYQNLDFSSTTSLITSGASELLKLKYGETVRINGEDVEINKLENWTNNVLDRTGVDVMIDNSAPGKFINDAAFYADLAARIIKHKDKLTFENYLFATTYLYYLTPIRPDIGPSGYNRTGKDWRILGYAEGGIGAKVVSVAKNIGKSFLNTVTGGLLNINEKIDNVGAEKFIKEVYDVDDVNSNPSVDKDNVDISRLRKLDFTGDADKNKKDISYKGKDIFESKSDNNLFNKNDTLKENSSIVPGIIDDEVATQDGSGVITVEKSNFQLHKEELSDELLFKGRSVIQEAQKNGFMINNQFNWDIKIEPLFNKTDYSENTNSELVYEYCNINGNNVPDLADYLGPNWLPVTDFNVNFTTNSVSQVQIGTGINIPSFNKVDFPSTLSLSIYESNALAIKQWLIDYQSAIYDSYSGGHLTRPYQFAASKCTIYMWSIAPIKDSHALFKAMNRDTYNKYYNYSNLPGITRRYVLYIIPINFDLQLNGAGAPSLESRNLSFTIVGYERGYSLDGNPTNLLNPDSVFSSKEKADNIKNRNTNNNSGILNLK